MNTEKNRAKGIVFSLSCADLKHEWILTLCLILAITAVLSPLLLMFGLKFGIIDVALNFMMTDPRYREIRPLASRSFEKEWFEQMRQRPDVDFIIPMTRNISATVDANLKEKKERMGIIPTAPGDPLLLENGTAVPGEGECVLTQLAAESLGAKTGDIITVQASRIKGTSFEYGTMEMKVKGILGIRASGLKSLYVKLEILEAVERFKDGQAVPEFGWNGSAPSAYPLYDGLTAVLPEKLDGVEELSLCSRTGFSKIERLDQRQLKNRAGYSVSPDRTVYHLATLKTPAGEESITEIRNRLRGKNAHLFPWIAPIQAALIDASGREIRKFSLQCLSADEESAAETGLSPIPEWRSEDSGERTENILKIMLPSGVSVNGKDFFLKLENNGEILSFPVSVLSGQNESEDMALVPAKLGGILRLFQQRNIRYDENLKEFILFRQGYAGFRLYAKSIFDVDHLRKFFEKQSLLVYTEIAAISRIINLNKGMGLIFFLMASLGISGCAASLTASLYASVERKKREMSVLRLIGLSGFKLFCFPVYQGMLIGAGGFFVSLLLFQVFAALIHQWFRPYVEKLVGFALEEGISFCHLPFLYIAAAFLSTIVIAALAAVIAAFRITRIEPAEALRDE